MQKRCNWRDKSKPIVFTPTPKQTLYRLMHQSTIRTLTVRQIHCQTYSHMPKNNQEEPIPITGDSEDLELSQDTNRTDFEPKSVQNPAEYPPYQDAEQFWEQHQDKQRSQLENIPELEDEDWEDEQFVDADLIDHHNTKTESNQI